MFVIKEHDGSYSVMLCVKMQDTTYAVIMSKGGFKSKGEAERWIEEQIKYDGK